MRVRKLGKIEWSGSEDETLCWPAKIEELREVQAEEEIAGSLHRKPAPAEISQPQTQYRFPASIP
jgi:hypothetical protein